MAGQTEQVLNAILRDIEAGHLVPGAALEENELVTRHGVSRTPVREAFIQLEAIGLIKGFPRKGAVLFKPTLEEFLAILVSSVFEIILLSKSLFNLATLTLFRSSKNFL